MRQLTLGFVALLAAATAAGAEESAVPAPLPPAADTAEPAAAAEPKEEGELPQIGGEDRLAVFVLERGFYTTGDLGVFMTFGGTRGYSNIQPFVAVKAGFDVTDYLSVQLALSAGYSSGNPLSDNDADPTIGARVVDYSLFNMGAEIVGALRPTQRFAIEPKIGGGMTRIHPQPHDPSSGLALVPGFSPHAVFGVDFKYLTLLTDFTAGVSLTGYAIFSQTVIPAASAAFVVRYTF